MNARAWSPALTMEGLRALLAACRRGGSLDEWATVALEFAEHRESVAEALKLEVKALRLRLAEYGLAVHHTERRQLVVPDGTGVEWRRRRGAVQHRFAAAVFGPKGQPGPWIDTEDVGKIVHPARVAAIQALVAAG